MSSEIYDGECSYRTCESREKSFKKQPSEIKIQIGEFYITGVKIVKVKDH